MIAGPSLDDAYRLTSGPQGYLLILMAIAALVGRDMLRATGRQLSHPAAGVVTVALTVCAFAIVGVRLAALASL